MKIVRLYTGNDQKSHFEETRAQLWRQSTDADDRISSRNQRDLSLRARRAFSRSPPGAAAPIPGDTIRLMGNRSQQRRQARLQDR